MHSCNKEALDRNRLNNYCKCNRDPTPCDLKALGKWGLISPVLVFFICKMEIITLPAQGHYEEQSYSSEHRDLRVLSGPVINPKGIPEAERLVRI